MRRSFHQIARQLRERATRVVGIAAALAVVAVGIPVGIMAAANATTAPTQNLFSPQPTSAPTSTDARAVELGVNFVPAVSGQILGVEFLKSTRNVGTHTGSLWIAGGALLATATFTKEAASGWQRVLFATPVTVRAGTIYTAGYHAPFGRYDSTEGYFTAPRTSGMLGIHTAAGRKRYSSQTVMPTVDTGNYSNYWVDVIFAASAVAPSPTATASPSPSASASPTPLALPSPTATVSTPAPTPTATSPTPSPTRTSTSPTPTATSTSPTPTPPPTSTSPTPTATSASPTASPNPSLSSSSSSSGQLNCLTRLAACGYPDASTTGAHGTLTAFAGTFTTTTDGQVVADLNISGTLNVVNKNVTVRDVKATALVDTGSGATFTDISVVATGGPGIAAQFRDATVTRADISGGNDNVRIAGVVTITDSYLHAPIRNAAGNSHDDCIQILAGGGTVTHSTLIANNGSDFNNSGFQFGEQSGSETPITFTDDLFDGGNYTLSANYGSTTPNSDPAAPNSAFAGPHPFASISVTGSRFGAHTRYGVLLPSMRTPPSGTFTWTNNIMDATGAVA
jgi:Domain of unknown function (DUF4082)